jgi:hypothetical protein
MKIFLSLLFITFSAFSFENKVEISTDGLGFNYSETDVDNSLADSSNTFRTETTQIKLNYSRKVSERFWLEGHYIYTSAVTISDSSLGDTETERISDTVYLGTIFDFNKDPKNSWNLFAGFSSSSLRDEDGDLVISLEGFRFGGGKRWSLDFVNIPNLSFELALIVESGDVDSDLTEDSYNGYDISYIPSAKFQLFF